MWLGATQILPIWLGFGMYPQGRVPVDEHLLQRQIEVTVKPVSVTEFSIDLTINTQHSCSY